MRSLLMNGAGLAASLVFVSASIAGATWLLRGGRLGAPTARKVIHIAEASWWLIAMAMFDDPWAASIGPACSLLASSVFPLGGVVPREDGESRARDRGIISYSAALLVLVNLSWRGIVPQWVAGIGVLVMGWGDGLAALVGVKFGRAGLRIWGRRKTVQGTAAMFLAAFLITLIFNLVFDPRTSTLPARILLSLSTAGVATALELLTPLGVDNLTISLGTALFYAEVM
jgi:phytol kinase